MPIVDDNDINVFLPDDKIMAENANLLDSVKEDADRIVRGNLAGYVDAVEMATWTTPDDTPLIIRAIGGRLCAALIYRRAYSEDSLEDPQYAQFLYNEAMTLLNRIIAGDLTLDPDVVPGIELTTDLFYPNDPNTDPPKFRMSDTPRQF
jgi:hypothetical protein